MHVYRQYTFSAMGGASANVMTMSQSEPSVTHFDWMTTVQKSNTFWDNYERLSNMKIVPFY